MKSNSSINVASLRSDGYKVRVTHKRVYPLLVSDNDDSFLTKKEAQKCQGIFPTVISSFGGYTTVEVTCPDGRELVGEAKCSSKQQFNRKLAVRIALGRALMGVK